ncbi:hypothetical protein [Streptomyces noursei]
MTRVQLTDEEREFIGPYLPIGEYGPYLGVCSRRPTVAALTGWP